MPSGIRFSAVESLVEMIYESMLDQRMWPRFVELACDVFGASSAHLIATSTINREGFWLAHCIDPAALESYERYYVGLSPWRARYPVLGPGSAISLRGESLVPDDTLVRSEFYLDFLRPLGQRWMCAAFLRPEVPRAPSYGLFMYRGANRNAFEPEAEDALAEISRNLLRLERLVHAVLTWREAHNSADVAAFLLTERGRLLGCNKTGEALIAERLVLPGMRSFGFGSQHADSWLYGALSRYQAAPHDARALRHLVALSPSRELELTLAPFAAPGSSPLTRAARVLLTVRRVDNEADSPLDDVALGGAVRERFRWTRSETDTVLRLVNGATLAQIAAMRECAVETVRSHIKSAKRKAGVSRQLDLVRIVHQLRDESERR